MLSLPTREAGGCARFIMDDGYAAGPRTLVFAALERFIYRLRIATNLVAQRAKFVAYSPAFDLTDYAPLLDLGGTVSTFTGPTHPDGPDEVGYGVMVGGVPVGDRVYEQQQLHVVVTRIESYSQHISDQLRDASHDAWALHHYCVAPDFDHWLRHVYPQVAVPFARRVDAAALDFVATIAEEPQRWRWSSLLLRRLRLPARMHGGGLRSREELAPAAFSACFVESVEAMVGARGSLAYFPSLARTFGVGAFDVGGSRFATYLQSQYRGAEAFHTAWVDLRMEVAGSGVIGPLDEVADEAGQGGVVRLQHAITQQREQVEMRLVHQALLARPVEDPKRIAYLAADRFSTQLVTAIPTPRRRASDAEFREMLCTYLALPSPCLRGLQGLRIADGQSYRSCDAHGHHLDCARLPGARGVDGGETATGVLVEGGGG